MINPFRVNVTGNNWTVPVSIMSFALGFMMVMAWITSQTRETRFKTLDPSQQQRVGSGSIDVISDNQKLTNEINKLRAEKTKLENAVGSNSKVLKVINDSLQQAKVFGGLTEVEGPGITITLRDNQKIDAAIGATTDDIIHDTDVLTVVNELWASGAEAISVNNHRVVNRTSFRCVGTTILVDGAKIATPVNIRAIGDTETLFGAMNLPGGALYTIKEGAPSMVQIEKVEKHRLPAYTGSTTIKFATPLVENQN